MILADKIINERKKNGWSQEELAQRLSVSRQSISKWESAQAVPDLQKILKMAEVFSVTTDYLLKDELEPETLRSEDYSKQTTSDTPLRVVTMEEADRFLNVTKKIAPTLANAVSFCIISPAVLIFLSGLEENRILSEALATGIGLVVLILLVAVAVYMFITTGEKTKEFKYLEKEPFETSYGVTGMVKEKQNEYKQNNFNRLPLGVALCILSVVPLLSVSMSESEYLIVGSVSLLLLIVSIGVNLIIRSCTVQGSFKKLLQESEYTIEEKKKNAYLEPISGIYWSIIVIIYLGSSFLTNKWGITWIIWPIAGIMYGIFASVFSLVTKNK